MTDEQIRDVARALAKRLASEEGKRAMAEAARKTRLMVDELKRANKRPLYSGV